MMKIRLSKFAAKAFTCLLAVYCLNNENILAATAPAQDSSLTFSYLNVINPFDGKSNLYQQILDEMNLEYENIGKREAARVLANSTNAINGGLNSIGFSYKKPFVDFSISVDRNLAPDLFDNKKWIVTDKFTIFIDASRVLSNLKNQKVIDITEKNLAAFAGIVFKRSFTWVHFANSYTEGLTTHFEKLFLPFTALQFDKIAVMQNNEIVLKEDSISVKAGGVVSAPLYTGVTGMAGVLAKFEKLTTVEVVSMPNPAGNEIHLSYEKSKISSLGATIGIQADFLKILRMTILSFDFNYEAASSYKIYLNFLQKSIAELDSSTPLAEQINEILKNREGDLNILAPYVISEEKKISQTSSHKYNFLLMGGIKNTKTQEIEITTDGRVKIFFRHYYEKIRYTENFLSRIFASVIYAVTNAEASAAKLVSDSKKVTIEYDSEKNLLENREDLNIKEDEQKLSMTFSAQFSTKKTTGISGRKYRDRALFFLSRYSGVDQLVIQMVERDHLTAPLSMTGQYQVNTEGIRYLNQLPVKDVFDYINGLCDESPKNKFFNFRNLFDNCRRSLQNDFLSYHNDLTHEKVTADAINLCESESKNHKFSSPKERAYLKTCLSKVTSKAKEDWVEIPLWSLKNFSKNIVNNSNSKVHYYNLFGVQNVFFHGVFDAKTADGRDFSTSFHEGAFKGLGAVDHYMRLENLRAPSSVVIDQ